MKILPVQNLNTSKSFKGTTKYYSASSDMYNTWDSLHIELFDSKEKAYGYISHDPKKNLQKILFENLEVEEVSKEINPIHTNKIYIADPMEGITDDIRKNVDYIVYEKQPKYPDLDRWVSLDYFHRTHQTDRDAAGKKFENLRNYYIRLQNADIRTLKELELSEDQSRETQEKIHYYKSRVKDASYEQWQAQECLNIYNESQGLRYAKEGIEGHIEYLQNQISGSQAKINECQSNIAKNNFQIENYQEDIVKLQQRKESYGLLAKDKVEVDSIIAKEADYQIEKEEKFLNRKIASIEKTIKIYQDKISKLQYWTENLKQEVQKCSLDVMVNRSSLSEHKYKLEKVKADLIPYFEKLKNFYSKQKLFLRI